MKRAGLAAHLETGSGKAVTAVDDGRCMFEHEGTRCPLPAKCWKTKGNDVDGPKRCVGHDELRNDAGGSRVFLKLALQNRHPFVPNSSDAIVARRMLGSAPRSSIEAAYGPRMIPWLEANEDHGVPGKTWQRDYREAVREAVKLEQQYGEAP